MIRLRDILRPVTPELIRHLMRIAETRSQTAFAELAELDVNTISRYNTGARAPNRSFPNLVRAARLTLEQMGWLLGYLLEKTFRHARLELPGEPREVKEWNARYGAAGLTEEVADILRLDLTRLDPHDSVSLTTLRHAIRELCEDAQRAQTELTSKLRNLVAAFQEIHLAAVHRARAAGRL